MKSQNLKPGEFATGSNKVQKCQLCGFEYVREKPYLWKGKVICVQCRLGEVENPEHRIR